MGLGNSVSSESVLKAEYLHGGHVYATAWEGKGGMSVCQVSCPFSVLPGSRSGDMYEYSQDLVEIESMRAPVSLQDVPAQLRSDWTPLEVSVWEQELEPHCERTFANYLISGLKCSFRIGYDYSAFNCVSARANMQSALKNAPVVEEKLAVELEKGRIVGPLSLDQFPQVHASRFGVIPKNHQPRKWRLIVDLSHPKGSSVNDRISPALCSLHYYSADEAVRQALALGEHTQLAKFDLENAYRVVPVHPTDRLLLGMLWKGKLWLCPSA